MRTFIRAASFGVVTFLIMWTGASVALADTIPPLPVAGVDWEKWISVVGVGLGGLGLALHGTARLIGALAPHDQDDAR